MGVEEVAVCVRVVSVVFLPAIISIWIISYNKNLASKSFVVIFTVCVWKRGD